MPKISPAEFKSRIQNRGYTKLGLCMFAPAPLAGLVNRRLNTVYGDSGDNLSVKLVRSPLEVSAAYVGGNYSSASLAHAEETIDIFSEVPGCVLLVTERGVGSQSVATVGLIEHGQVELDIAEEHSYFSFAENHLGLRLPPDPDQLTLNQTGSELLIAGILLDGAPANATILKTPWEAIFHRIVADPTSLDQFASDPRSFEEFIAESYHRDGYQVELTPRSGDGGVDVIAEKKGFGAIKILDQTKAYSSHRLVSANDVRAAVGVLQNFPDASKAIVTTTSGFAPRTFSEFAHMTPTRLELRDGQSLIKWLKSLNRG